MVRKNAWRSFALGTVFDCGEQGLYVLRECVPEEDDQGNRLTLRQMNEDMETVWRVMMS